MSLNSRIKELEDKIATLTSKVWNLSRNTESKTNPPYSIIGSESSKSEITPIDIKAGWGHRYGGSIVWNSSELGVPPGNVEPSVPNAETGKGYNKHTHTRFSGGALIKGGIEIVDYDFSETPVTNIHSQQFWVTQPNIKTDINTNKESVDKIGLLDLVFNPDTKTWGCPAYEIDVKKCYLVERDANGNIVLDSKGREMKSPLYNTDPTKTSIVWDENGNCWRLYAAYAPGV